MDKKTNKNCLPILKPGEIIKNINGLEYGYMITNTGKVWSKPRRTACGRYTLKGRWMKAMTTNGKKTRVPNRVMLKRENGEYVNFLVSDLVFSHYYGEIPAGYNVSLKDKESKSEPFRLENLVLTTKSERSQLYDRKAIIKDLKSNLTITQARKKYGCRYSVEQAAKKIDADKLNDDFIKKLKKRGITSLRVSFLENKYIACSNKEVYRLAYFTDKNQFLNIKKMKCITNPYQISAERIIDKCFGQQSSRNKCKGR